jgi:putative NIF3 family GTP cyclohydrolase 1 type 2
MSGLTRRQFTRDALIAAGGAAVAAGRPLPSFAQPATPALTAGAVFAAIKAHLKMEWDTTTYRDTIKIGDEKTIVTGVASCFMDSLDVLKRAHAQKLNLVVTHEPTFWSDADRIEDVKSDPLYLAKRGFAEKNGMVVLRLHDHWHRVVPEPMTTGMRGLLGWDVDPADPRLFRVPPTKLSDLARHVAVRLYTASVRIVGDPNLMVTSVARGGHALSQNMSALDRADVALSSEVREWESVEYARDLIASGAKKGLFVLSHEAGEEEGMRLFADWMRTVTPSLPTAFVSTHDRLFVV